MSIEPLVRTDEAAQLLQVNVQTVRRWVREGRIPCVRAGAQIRFRRRVLDEWLEGRVNRREGE